MTKHGGKAHKAAQAVHKTTQGTGKGRIGASLRAAIACMVIYDFENRWQLRNDPRNPYIFAFKDWQFRGGKGVVDGTSMLWPLKEELRE